MRKFKFIGDRDSNFPELQYDKDYYSNLVIGEIYNITNYIHDEMLGHYDEIWILIDGMEHVYFISDFNNIPIFEDATVEYRNNVISNILL